FSVIPIQIIGNCKILHSPPDAAIWAAGYHGVVILFFISGLELTVLAPVSDAQKTAMQRQKIVKQQASLHQVCVEPAAKLAMRAGWMLSFVALVAICGNCPCKIDCCSINLMKPYNLLTKNLDLTDF
ncbi:hypothetical protein, partial [Herminiimonas sp. CN]|uniref:hypothetical protein n=1 Tax=Herminiimonas sp. CN TaxID=1349818 RepID=UPI00054F89CA